MSKGNPPTKNPLPSDAELSAFYQKHKDHQFLQLNPLYAIPKNLLQALYRNVPNLLSPDDWKLEGDFTYLCEKKHALGLVDHAFIPKSLIYSTSALPFTDADVKILQEITGKTSPEDAKALQHAVQVGVDRIDHIRSMDRPYLGWLITNPEYLKELAAIKQRWNAGSTTSPALAKDFAAFLRKWQLAQLIAWDLPCAQGAFPKELFPHTAGINISVPYTAGTPAIDAIRESITDTQDHQAPPHLAGWINVVRRRGGKLGVARFEHIFHVRFYRDVVLARHAKNFPGNIDSLDRAFGEFLGVSEEEIRKIRVTIKKRLSGKSPVLPSETEPPVGNNPH